VQDKEEWKNRRYTGIYCYTNRILYKLQSYYIPVRLRNWSFSSASGSVWRECQQGTSMLQSKESAVGPSHPAPPSAGGGPVHVRLLVLAPPPQGDEHLVQDVHGAHAHNEYYTPSWRLVLYVTFMYCKNFNLPYKKVVCHYWGKKLFWQNQILKEVSCLNLLVSLFILNTCDLFI